MNKTMKPATSQDIFDNYKHHIGTHDIDGNIVTEESLKAWAENPDRKLICIFCGSEANDWGGFIYCHNCHEYKGIMPDVNGVL